MVILMDRNNLNPAEQTIYETLMDLIKEYKDEIEYCETLLNGEENFFEDFKMARILEKVSFMRKRITNCEKQVGLVISGFFKAEL